MPKKHKSKNESWRFMSFTEVAETTTLSEGTIRSLISEGSFPLPVDVTGFRKAFIDHEVYKWMAGRVEQRGAANV